MLKKTLKRMTKTEGFLEHPVFGIVSKTAGELGVRAFVIGGYVRDCFLGRPSNDIDIVVEGSGIALATAVAERIKKTERHGCRVSVFKNFGTAMLKYHGTEVEFVGARKESYHRDSRKPIVRRNQRPCGRNYPHAARPGHHIQRRPAQDAACSPFRGQAEPSGSRIPYSRRVARVNEENA